MTVREMLKELANVEDLDAVVYFRDGLVSYEIQSLKVVHRKIGERMVILQLDDD